MTHPCAQNSRKEESGDPNQACAERDEPSRTLGARCAALDRWLEDGLATLAGDVVKDGLQARGAVALVAKLVANVPLAPQHLAADPHADVGLGARVVAVRAAHRRAAVSAAGELPTALLLALGGLECAAGDPTAHRGGRGRVTFAVDADRFGARRALPGVTLCATPVPAVHQLEARRVAGHDWVKA